MKLFILDNNENLIGSLSGDAEKSATHFFNAVVVKELNKGRQLTFEVDMKEDGVADLIKEEHHVIFKDGEKFRLVTIKEVVDIHNSDFIKEVFCDDASIELYDEVILTDLDSTVSHEVDDVANHILRDTRWTLGECDNVRRMKLTDKLATKTVLNGLNMIVDKFNVEVDFEVEFVHNRISERRVILKEKLGRDLGKRIEYRKDMESLKRTVDSSDIKTAVIPFGKQNEETGEYVTIRDVIWTADRNGLDKPAGQLYLEDKTATEQWGYKGENGKRPRWIAVEYPEVESPNELINYANMQLASHKEPKVTYEVEAVDLYKLLDDEAYSFETLEIGDAVAIIDREFNPPLTLKSRIVKIEESYSKWNSGRKITLGNVIPTLVDKDIKTQVAELGGAVGSVTVDLSGINNRLDNLEDKTGTGVWEALEPINQVLFNQESGYHYMSESDGIWVYDRPADQQPTKAIVLKGGQLGIAKWDKQTQSWKVGTFIDGNNVNASMINTGTLSADRIKAGSITAEKLEVSVKNKINNSVTNEEVEAKLKVQADSIKAEVSNTYETKTAVTDKINAIQVGTRNYVRDYKFRKPNVWAKSNSSATVDNENNWGKLDGQTSNTFLSQILPDGELNSGDTFTLQYEIRCENVQAGTGTDSFLIRTQLTGYTNDGGYVSDIGIFAKHESEVATLNENGWTKVVKTLTLSYDVELDYIRLRLYARNFEGAIYFRNIKLERGTKATDLAPAPEDYDAELLESLENYYTSEQINDQLQGLIDQSNDLVLKYENMVTDKVITPNEKVQLKAEFEQMTDKYENIGLLVEAIDNPTLDTHYTELGTIYDSVRTALSPFLLDMTTVQNADESAIYSKISAFHGQYETVLRLSQTVLNNTVTTVKTEVNQVATGVQTAITKSEEALGVTKTIGKHFEFTEDGWVRIYASLNGVKGSFMTQITDSRLSFYDGETEVAYISNKDLYITDARIINTLHVGNMALEKSAKGGMIFKWKG